MLLSFFSKGAIAQIEGTWKGTVLYKYNKDIGVFHLVIEKVEEEKVYGYTWIDFGQCAAKTAVVGTYKENELKIKEVQILNERGEYCDWCLLEANLTLNEVEGKKNIEGNYMRRDGRRSICEQGRLILTKKEELKKDGMVKSKEKNDTIIMKANKQILVH